MITMEQSIICIVKISRLQANLQKLQNYFTSTISQYTAVRSHSPCSWVGLSVSDMLSVSVLLALL